MTDMEKVDTEAQANAQGWPGVLGPLPFPAAVLDAEYRYVLLNAASACDGLLGRSQVGDVDVGSGDGEPALQRRALERHRYYAQCLQQQQPLVFEERSWTSGKGLTSQVWTCIPVCEAGQRQLVVVGLRPGAAEGLPVAVAGGAEAAEGKRVAKGGEASGEGLTISELVQTINKELRVPLSALVGMAGSLVGELTGEQRTRAIFIDQSGRRVLKQLNQIIEGAKHACKLSAPSGPPTCEG